jgi:hypothetical protein
MATSDKNGNNTWLKELRKEKIKQRNLVSDEQINIAILKMRKGCEYYYNKKIWYVLKRGNYGTLSKSMLCTHILKY